jgi:beta-1,4-mannosyl-glycoprotein beta-1,4-N-acetylglucosaminyltransferase
MKTFDCFTFFNELDLLKIRLELLEDVVDYHVIVESNVTHSGLSKNYNLEDNWDSFTKWKNKLIYIRIDQPVDGLQFEKVKSYSPGNGSWVLENQQRNAIQNVIDIVGDIDLVLIGDLDEIPDPEAVLALKEHLKPGYPVALSMLFHYYYMNCQNVGYERYWNGTVGCKGVDFKNITPQEFRDKRNNYQRFSNGGYHFSFLGGVEKIRTKIQSFAHTEFNREDILSEENIVESIEKGKDIFNRPGVSYEFVNPYQYPQKIRELMYKYPHLMKYENKRSS